MAIDADCHQFNCANLGSSCFARLRGSFLVPSERRDPRLAGSGALQPSSRYQDIDELRKVVGTAAQVNGLLARRAQMARLDSGC